METIFVKNVYENSPAHRAGLHHGDRLVSVNGYPLAGKTYAEVVLLIQNSPPYLHLLVVPKEDDVLQKFFPETAHNPETNQRSQRFVSPETFSPRRLQKQQILQQQQQALQQQHQASQQQQQEWLKYRPIVYQAPARSRAADAVSWRSYEEPSHSSGEQHRSSLYQPLPHPRTTQVVPVRDTRSSEQLYSVPRDNLLYRPITNPRTSHQHQRNSLRDSLGDSIYAEPYAHDFSGRPRAQPQVPVHLRNMGRRASEGSNISENSRDINYDNVYPECSSLSSEYPDCSISSEYPECSSLGSDSLALTDMVVNSSKMKSASKVAGHLPSDSAADPMGLSYINSAGCRLSLDAERRESSASLNSSLADGSKDSLSSYDSASTLTGQDTDDSIIMTRFRKSFEKKEEFLRRPSQPTGWRTGEDTKLIPAVIQREFYSRPQKLQKEWPPNEPSINGQESPSRNASKPQNQNFQRVQIAIDSERDYLAKESLRNDMQVARNKFYEAATGQPAQFIVGGLVSNASQLQRNSNIRQSKDKNSFVTTLSRIHESTPPVEYGDDVMITNGCSSLPISAMPNENVHNLDDRRYPVPPNLQIVSRRTRQFESGRSLPEEEEDGSLSDRTNFYRSELSRLSSKRVVPNVAVRKREFEILEIENNKDCRRDRDLNRRTTQRESRSLDNSDVPIENDNSSIYFRARSNSAESWMAAMQNSITNRKIKDMADEKQRNKVGRQDSYITALQSKIPVPGDVPPQVIRRSKNTNSYGEEDRATRRVSYLKATWGDRMHVESDLDLSDNESPQALRSRSGSAEDSGPLCIGRPDTPTSPERETVPITRDGPLYCKFMELEGKRANDRSWHKVWAVLRGPHLFLYKDRHHYHHQSPMGLVDTDQQLPGGVDMRYSVVNVADDYTKRKNVLRISSAYPYRTELLLQADTTIDMADWVRTLQEQTGASTEEEKHECLSENKQAMPQQTPAATSVQVQGTARLSPQPCNKSKIATSRNRSPTGQSPKSKTWRGRVVKQFKKLNQGSGSPNSPTTPEKLTFGIPLEHCQKSKNNEFVPMFVEMCTEIIEEKGLEVVGIYRVPGNNAAVSALTEELNKGINLALQDVHSSDTNVVSSLLKSFFRKLPDSLLTSDLYPRFIEADKIDDPKIRLYEIKKLLNYLPDHQYATLKHLILHLKKVVDNSEINKMEARNLAIVFGPTLVRKVEDNMVSMVTDMSHQCRIVESLLLYGEWFFTDEDSEVLNVNTNMPTDVTSVEMDNTSATVNNSLLLGNISKIEGKTESSAREKKDIMSSIISAANKKIQRKSRKAAVDSSNTKEEVTTPTSDSRDTSLVPLLRHSDEQKQPSLDSEESSSSDNVIPDDPLMMTYPQLEAKTNERVEKFRQETMAMLQQKRRSEISRTFVKPIYLQNGEPVESTESQTSSDLLATITSVFDNKIKALQSPTNNCLTVADNIPYADESPDVTLNSFDSAIVEGARMFNKESQKCDHDADKMSPKSFRNPSLHKNFNSGVNISKQSISYSKSSRKNSSEVDQKEKDVDEHDNSASKTQSEGEQKTTDELNELCKINFNNFIMNKELKCSASDSKLKRSESLNKSDNRDCEQEHGKLKRSVSLNRAADRLKRSDSLTKYEKTESNINLRRELADDTNRRLKKGSTKLKRKNGMPERSIKRRHTVGGTKDFDRIHWIDNRLRYEAEESTNEEKEKVAMRSSSPDLSGGKKIIHNANEDSKLPLESHI